jgi:hypothetical protein
MAIKDLEEINKELTKYYTMKDEFEEKSELTLRHERVLQILEKAPDLDMEAIATVLRGLKGLASRTTDEAIIDFIRKDVKKPESPSMLDIYKGIEVDPEKYEEMRKEYVKRKTEIHAASYGRSLKERWTGDSGKLKFTMEDTRKAKEAAIRRILEKEEEILRETSRDEREKKMKDYFTEDVVMSEKAKVPRFEPKTDVENFEDWALFEILLDNTDRICVTGPPGIGKTYTPGDWARKKERQIFHVTMTPDTSMAELRGHFIAKGGDWVWHDGVLSAWWRKENSLLIINEIDFCGDDVKGYLYGALDDFAFASITLPTGETIHPSGGQKVVATMNGSFDELPPALMSRFPVKMKLDTVHPKALELLPEDLRNFAANLPTTKSKLNFTYREVAEYGRLREAIGEKNASKAIFGDNHKDILNSIKIAR